MSKQIFRLSLNSTYEESEKVPDFVTEIQEKSQLEEDATGNLMLLLSEAVTNAIVHGNKLDESKKVEVEVHVNSEKIISTVKDQGKGFNPKTTKNPLKEENLLRDSGRGIFLIREISDSMDYLEDGTKIRFSLSR
ncbi:ATP-binding protein [Rhodohalobacter sp. 614A]|uniref:ATP-binding protein n=1 Tax=Rhodohalobacter sp. 614A TaxID=2908649 RepID=UPI001F1777D4|nr:ATP-binding protein [Rhodohalobacter sp. 614A]